MVFSRALLVLLALLLGCQAEQSETKPVATPVPVIQVNDTFSEFVVEEQQPVAMKQLALPTLKSDRPRRDPFAKGDNAVAEQAPPPSPKAKPRPKKLAKRPSFTPQSDYPIAVTNDSDSPEKILGVPGERLKDEAARPIFHPAVVTKRRVDYSWLQVRFEVRVDGSCRPTLESSTGDPIFDQEALQTLRRWRWKPLTVEGHAVACTVSVRLTRTR